MNQSSITGAISRLGRAVDRLFLRILMTVCRGRITAVNDAGGIQIVQVTFGSNEVIDNMMRTQEYGFTSVPNTGCHAVAVFIGGDRSNGAVIATNDLTARLKGLQPGDVAIYDARGQKVYLAAAGIRLYSPISYQYDVGGYGQKITALGGDAWQIDNYTTGATVTTNNHPVSPPEIS
jgi:phage baseplate assembly protein V